MADIILILGVGAIIIFGYFAIKKLDSIVYSNRRIVEREDDDDDEIDEVIISAKLPKKDEKTKED